MPAWEFAPIPAELTGAVRAAVPTIVRSVIAAVGVQSPDYRGVLEAPEGLGLRLGIEQAVVAFLDGAEHGEHPSADAGELWRRLGEGEFQAGRGLEPMRTAFRTGTRALWREAARVAAAADVPTELVMSLAEAIFVYTDELAADVVEGYMRAQSDDAGESERRRRRVALLLTDPAGVDMEALSRAAALAHWPVPRRLAVLAVGTQSPVAITRQLDVDVLVGADTEGTFVVLADPDGPGRRAVIEHAVAAEVCAMGPVVGVRETLRSLRWARWLLDLGSGAARFGLSSPALSGGTSTAGAEPPGRLLAADDHLVDLIVLRDRELADALVARHLGPLDALGEAERDRLEETLAAWLAYQRHTPSVAEALHVHPQTVRYRMARLRELLGAPLDDPDGRFELELALRARRR